MTASTATPERRHVRELDWLMLAVVGLSCIGLVMAVSVLGPQPRIGGVLQAMKMQGGKMLAGLVAFLACALVPISWLRRLALPAFGVAVLLCFAAPVIGPERNHAHRWLTFGSFQFQPVELARFLLVIATAHMLAQVRTEMRSFLRGFLPSFACAGVLVVALLLQPDHGNALLVLALTTCIALVAGVRYIHFVPIAAIVLTGIVVKALGQKYVVDRVTGFLDIRPNTQVGQAMLAIASGGALGRGIGQGWMKMGYVPEAQNDMVFAVVAEELGYLGSLLVLGLYTVIGVVGYRLVCTIRDPFCRFLVCGFVMLICMQAAINLLVVSGWSPAKGIDLPFVSTGGTSMMFFLAATGLIGNATRADRFLTSSELRTS